MYSAFIKVKNTVSKNYSGRSDEKSIGRTIKTKRLANDLIKTQRDQHWEQPNDTSAIQQHIETILEENRGSHIPGGALSK